MQYFINGAKYAFSTVIGEAVPITEISNANPAVALTATPPAEGDVVLLDSNWTDLSEQATYATNVDVDSFELAQIDTLDTMLYPEGESAGNYRIASGFTNLSQIREITQTGGDTNQFTWGYIDDRSPRQRSRPTDQNPLVLTFTMDYDPDLAWASALDLVSKARQLVVMRERLPTGDTLLYSGYLSYQKSPSRVRNENMTVTATMSINSEVLRFPVGSLTP